MKTQDIKNLASAYMQVLEKAKMDKVNPKALDKDFDDRQDKDIDNDGDVDNSDEYLHNRRKAVKKAMKNEEADLTEESKTIAKVKEIVANKGAMKIDGVMVDMFTASAIAQIYDKVNDANKAKMDKMKITQLANAALKIMKRMKEEVELSLDEEFEIYEGYAKSAAQQAAIAIAKKEKGMSEDDDLDEISIDALKKNIKTAGNYKKVAKIHGADKIKRDLAMLRKGLVKESPEDNEVEQVDEAKSKEQQIADLEKMLNRISGNTSSVKMKKYALQKKIDKLKNEELEEAAPKMQGDWLKKQREKDREHNAAMGRTATGRKKPQRAMTSTQRSLASLRREEAEELDENKALMKDYQGLKAQGKSDSSIMDILMSMPKYKRMNKDQMRKIIGDAKRKGIFKEEVELDEAMNDDDWVVLKGRKVVRTIKNPKNNKAPRNWQKSSDETEIVRISKAKKMGIMEEVEDLDEGAKEKALKALMTKALGGKRAKPGYTSAVANNGDFVVKDGGGRIVGRIKSGDYTDPLKEAMSKAGEDAIVEAYHDAPQSSKNTSKDNPLITTYDDGVHAGRPGITGHMNLQTWMNIHGISKRYQKQLAAAVMKAGAGKKVKVDVKVTKDYNDERKEEGLKPRMLWIELSKHMKEDLDEAMSKATRRALQSVKAQPKDKVSLKPAPWDKKKDTKNMSMKEKLQLQKEAILEREMTDAEMKKREEIVKGMKKDSEDMKKRYGAKWKDVMYATATKQAMESVDKALSMTKGLLTTKESFDTEDTKWPVYAKIKENRAMHTRGAAPGDPTMMDKMTASDKAFIDAHDANGLGGRDSGIDGAKAAEDTARNAAAQVKAGGGMNRTGDQKTGDKNIVKSTEAK